MGISRDCPNFSDSLTPLSEKQLKLQTCNFAGTTVYYEKPQNCMMMMTMMMTVFNKQQHISTVSRQTTVVVRIQVTSGTKSIVPAAVTVKSTSDKWN